MVECFCISQVTLFPLGPGVASGLWTNLLVLSLEASGWVCGYWRIRFRSRLNYIFNGWVRCRQYMFFDRILLKCSWHHCYVCDAFIGNALSRLCKRSSVIDLVLGCLQISTINQRHHTHFNVCITVICCWAGHSVSTSFQQSVAASVHVIPTCTRVQVSYTCVSGIVLLAGYLDTVLYTLRYICNMYSFVLSPF